MDPVSQNFVLSLDDGALDPIEQEGSLLEESNVKRLVSHASAFPEYFDPVLGVGDSGQTLDLLSQRVDTLVRQAVCLGFIENGVEASAQEPYLFLRIMETLPFLGLAMPKGAQIEETFLRRLQDEVFGYLSRTQTLNQRMLQEARSGSGLISEAKILSSLNDRIVDLHNHLLDTAPNDVVFSGLALDLKSLRAIMHSWHLSTKAF